MRNVEQDLSRLADRVQALEARNHRYRIALVLGAVVLGSAVSLGLARPKGRAQDVDELLRTHRLEVIDAEGTVRAVLGMGDDGQPRFGLLDAAGTVIWSAP